MVSQASLIKSGLKEAGKKDWVILKINSDLQKIKFENIKKPELKSLDKHELTQ